jgi:hypothetical protein
MWISNDQLHEAFKRAKLSCRLSLPPTQGQGRCEMERSDWSEFSCNGATSTRGPGSAAENPAYLGWVIGIDPLGRCDGPIKHLGRPWNIVALGLRPRDDDAPWPSRGLDGGPSHAPTPRVDLITSKATPMCRLLLAFRPFLADGWTNNHVLVNTMVSFHLITTTKRPKHFGATREREREPL